MSDDEVVAAARALARHRNLFESFTRPATDLILTVVGDALEVVDLASGTGEPALTLAAQLTQARIVATDRAGPLLAELVREARARGLSNIEALEVDMCALPLPAASVDCVVSRFGIQFAQDAVSVQREIMRVLRPGATCCHVVWGNPAQPLLRATLLDVLEATGGPQLAIGAPGPFQFSAPGSLSRLFAAAGFVDIHEQTHTATWTWHGDARSFWRFTRETSAALFEPLLAAQAPLARSRLIDSVVATLSAFERGAVLEVPVEVHCARGRSR
jgi:SAM-dependent methyltransferase